MSYDSIFKRSKLKSILTHEKPVDSLRWKFVIFSGARTLRFHLRTVLTSIYSHLTLSAITFKQFFHFSNWKITCKINMREHARLVSSGKLQSLRRDSLQSSLFIFFTTFFFWLIIHCKSSWLINGWRERMCAMWAREMITTFPVVKHKTSLLSSLACQCGCSCYIGWGCGSHLILFTIIYESECDKWFHSFHGESALFPLGEMMKMDFSDSTFVSKGRRRRESMKNFNARLISRSQLIWFIKYENSQCCKISNPHSTHRPRKLRFCLNWSLGWGGRSFLPIESQHKLT